MSSGSGGKPRGVRAAYKFAYHCPWTISWPSVPVQQHQSLLDAVEVVPHEARKAWMIVGINAVTRALERGQVKAVLVARDVPNALVLAHLPILVARQEGVSLTSMSTGSCDLGRALRLRLASVVAVRAPSPTDQVPTSVTALISLLAASASPIRVPDVIKAPADHHGTVAFGTELASLVVKLRPIVRAGVGRKRRRQERAQSRRQLREFPVPSA